MKRIINKATIEISGDDAIILMVSLGCRIDWSMKEQDFMEFEEHKGKLFHLIEMMQLLERCQDEFGNWSGEYKNKVDKYLDKKLARS